MVVKNCKSSSYIFCTLIYGFSFVKRSMDALDFLERSKKTGFELEAPTCSVVVAVYCWAMRLHDAYTMMNEMRKCGLALYYENYDIVHQSSSPNKGWKKKKAYSVFQTLLQKCKTMAQMLQPFFLTIVIKNIWWPLLHERS